MGHHQIDIITWTKFSWCHAYINAEFWSC